MVAAVYLRVENHWEETSITLIRAKFEVAPLKKVVIPMLELSAALILTELTAHIQQVVKYQHIEAYLWWDSSVALAWIRGYPSRWKEFVQNRVRIQETIQKAIWRHISGTDNPADCASIGLSSIQLAAHELWLNGPNWLKLPPHQWPTSLSENPAEVALEEKPQTAQSFPVQQDLGDDLQERYSSLSKVLRVLVRASRFINRLKRLRLPEDPVITAEEMETSRKYWIKKIQEQCFPKVIQQLPAGQPLRNHRPLFRLIQLPAPRVTPYSAFLQTEVDSAGHITVLKWKNSTRVNVSPGTFKAYIAVFICMATSAVHLELVADFGAEKELSQLFHQTSRQYRKMAAIIADDDTKSKFNPPQSPNFRGLWEAPVESTKYHLKRIANNTTMTFDQLSTLLTQIEAILNTRPLCPLRDLI